MSGRLLKIICAYPNRRAEDHLQIIKTEISQFNRRDGDRFPSALARVSHNAFRQFVIGVTGYAKQEEIAGFFTNTSEEFRAAIRSPITSPRLPTRSCCCSTRSGDTAPNVFKMRGYGTTRASANL